MKIKIIALVVMLVPCLFSQTWADLPLLMDQDTLYGSSRVTNDLFIKDHSSYQIGRNIYGPVDLDLYAKTKEASTTDTMDIEIYGLKRKNVAGTWVLNATDSVNAGTMALSDSYSFKSIAVDGLFTSFEAYDALRVVFKKGGTDTDSLIVYNNLRIVVDPDRN